MVPEMEKNLRAKMNLWLWKRSTTNQMTHNVIPVISLISKAQEMCGILSSIISGKGGYLFMSGTRSCTTVMVMAVNQLTHSMYIRANAVFHLSGSSLLEILLREERVFTLQAEQRGRHVKDGAAVPLPWGSESDSDSELSAVLASA
jgi:hypothetical protein